MDPDPHPEAPGDGGEQPVQPAVHARDLEAFRHTAEARRLEVMEADAALMMRLSVEGFEGTTWRRVAEALVEYGFTVMRSWVVTGYVFVKLREKGRPLEAPSALPARPKLPGTATGPALTPVAARLEPAATVPTAASTMRGAFVPRRVLGL